MCWCVWSGVSRKPRENTHAHTTHSRCFVSVFYAPFAMLSVFFSRRALLLSGACCCIMFCPYVVLLYRRRPRGDGTTTPIIIHPRSTKYEGGNGVEKESGEKGASNAQCSSFLRHDKGTSTHSEGPGFFS